MRELRRSGRDGKWEDDAGKGKGKVRGWGGCVKTFRTVLLLQPVDMASAL